MERKIKGVYNWGGNGKEKGQKGLESICYLNIQISKERYPPLLSLIPLKNDVPKFDACTQCEYSVAHLSIYRSCYLDVKRVDRGRKGGYKGEGKGGRQLDDNWSFFRFLTPKVCAIMCFISKFVMFNYIIRFNSLIIFDSQGCMHGKSFEKGHFNLTDDITF